MSSVNYRSDVVLKSGNTLKFLFFRTWTQTLPSSHEVRLSPTGLGLNVV